MLHVGCVTDSLALARPKTNNETVVCHRTDVCLIDFYTKYSTSSNCHHELCQKFPVQLYLAGVLWISKRI